MITAAMLAILALDDAWVKAEIAHDRQTLERILDESMVVTYAGLDDVIALPYTSGTTVGRKEFIDQILSRPIPPYEVVHDSVNIHGNTAVVVDRFGDGLRTKVMWVAVKKKGHWRVIAEQFTSVRQ